MSELKPQTFLDHVNTLIEPLQIEPETGLQARIIHLLKEYAEIDYLIEWDGQKCFSRGDFQVIKGKAKSGKSTFMISLLVTLLIGVYMGFKALKNGCVSLYIDTEQNPINTVKMVRKVHAICSLPLNEDDQRFTAINLRGDNPTERKSFIREALEKFKPQFIIIDGIKDLIEGGDINDEKESGKAVQFLMVITKEFNAAVLTVLHENKTDSNLRGHIGTELLNKCSEVWQVKKTDNVFEAEQIENRNDPSGIINFSFEFNEVGLPVMVESEAKQKPEEKTIQRKIESFYFCLQPGVKRTYKVLNSEYCEAYGCKEKTAENDIAKYLRSGFLLKDDVSKEYRFNIERMPIINPKQVIPALP